MHKNFDFVESNKLSEKDRAGTALGALLAGHKKDVILHPNVKVPFVTRRDPVTKKIADWDFPVVIFGGHVPPKTPFPVQGAGFQHPRPYADYSHGIRLVSETVLVTVDGKLLDDKPKRYSELLRDKDLSRLLLPGADSKFPTEYPSGAAPKPAENPKPAEKLSIQQFGGDGAVASEIGPDLDPPADAEADLLAVAQAKARATGATVAAAVADEPVRGTVAEFLTSIVDVQNDSEFELRWIVSGDFDTLAIEGPDAPKDAQAKTQPLDPATPSLKGGSALVKAQVPALPKAQLHETKKPHLVYA